MKKWARILFAMIVAALCVASLATSIAGATPSGKSGLNYFALDSGSYTVSTDIRQNVNVWGDYKLTYNPATSSLSVGQQYFDNATQIIFTINTNGAEVLRYVAGQGNMYYANAYLRLYDTQANLSYYHASRVTFYDLSGNIVYNGALYYGDDITDPFIDIDKIEIAFDLPNLTGTYSAVRMENLILTQGTPLYHASNPNRVEEDYVPYSNVWFEGFESSQDAYRNGYEQGYQVGALEAGGEPMQKWGAFILTAVTGFMNFELFPGMPLWGMLAVLISIPLVLTCLKYFAGG